MHDICTELCENRSINVYDNGLGNRIAAVCGVCTRLWKTLLTSNEVDAVAVLLSFIMLPADKML